MSGILCFRLDVLVRVHNPILQAQSQQATNTQEPPSCTHRIIQILNPLHQPHHSLTPRISDKSLLRQPQPMLRTNTSLPLLNPLIHPRLQRPLNLLIEPPRHNVQMQIRIAHMAVPYHLHNRVAIAIAHEPRVREPLPGFFD